MPQPFTIQAESTGRLVTLGDPDSLCIDVDKSTPAGSPLGSSVSGMGLLYGFGPPRLWSDGGRERSD